MKFIRKDIEEKIKKGKPIKHDYKTNLNKSIGTLKDEMVTLIEQATEIAAAKLVYEGLRGSCYPAENLEYLLRF